MTRRYLVETGLSLPAEDDIPSHSAARAVVRPPLDEIRQTLLPKAAGSQQGAAPCPDADATHHCPNARSAPTTARKPPSRWYQRILPQSGRQNNPTSSQWR